MVPNQLGSRGLTATGPEQGGHPLLRRAEVLRADEADARTAATRRHDDALRDFVTGTGPPDDNLRLRKKIIGSDEGLRLGERARLAQLAVTGHRLGCQNAISPVAGVAMTLRQPTGPSRGSSMTEAPS